MVAAAAADTQAEGGSVGYCGVARGWWICFVYLAHHGVDSALCSEIRTVDSLLLSLSRNVHVRCIFNSVRMDVLSFVC